MLRTLIVSALLVAGAAAQSGCVIVIADEDLDDDHFTVDHDWRDDGHDRHWRRGGSGGGAVLDEVRARFDADTFLRDAPILIAAREGVVTLRGEVDDPATLERAARIASEAPGVQSVVMKVVVLANP